MAISADRNSDRNYSEKRNFIRMRINTPVTIRHGEHDLEALCQDLSGSGLLVHARQPLPMGAEVGVHIEPQTGAQQAFIATAEVARVEPRDDGGYTIGFAIKAIHD